MTFTLRFPSGVLAQCMTSYGIHESRRLQVHTERGDIDLQNAFAYRGQRLVLSHPDGKIEAWAIGKDDMLDDNAPLLIDRFDWDPKAP